MAIMSLEINDAQLSIAIDGQLVDQLPGAVLSTPDGLVFGNDVRDAEAIARGDLYDQFWESLSETALKPPVAGLRHQADMVYLFLDYIWTKHSAGIDAVLLLVPGDYADEQVALLAAICRALNIPVNGIGDAALVASIDIPTSGIHVDVYWRRWVITALRPLSGGLIRRTVISVDGGVSEYEDRLAQMLANQFVRQTRFDPMHSAASEQALRDQIRAYIHAPSEGSDYRFTLQYGGRDYSILVGAHDMENAVDDIFGRVASHFIDVRDEDTAGSLNIGGLAAKLPGFTAYARRMLGDDVNTLQTAAAAVNAYASRQWMCRYAEDLHLILQLPLMTSTIQLQSATVPEVTHLLIGAVAYPLRKDQPLCLSDQPDPLYDGPCEDDGTVLATLIRSDRCLTIEPVGEDRGLLLNGEALVDKTTVKLGDCISTPAAENVLAIKLKQ